MLSNLTEIRVGGLGNAIFLDSSFELFGFSLINPTLGAVSEDFTGGDPAGFSVFGPLAVGPFSPGGLITVLSGESTPETLIGFVFSSLFLGNQAAAFGGKLSFLWAAQPGLVVDPPYVFENGGRVRLTGRSEGQEIPEPRTFFLSASALVLAALVSARSRQRDR